MLENEHISIDNIVGHCELVQSMNNTTSSPSTEYNFVEAVKKPIVYSYFVTITFTVITSVLNICVLSRRALRTSSCTYYFLASVPPVLVYAVFSPFNTILVNSYGFYMSNTSVTCKLIAFLVYTAPLLYGTMLMCATIDRYFASSTSVRLRQLSEARVARRIITIVWILASIYMSPFIFIYYFDYNANKCTQYSTILTTIYLITRVVLYYFLTPSILGIFGSLTIYNIRGRIHRVAPVNQTNLNRRTEGQLARMLIIQVGVYFLFFTPAGIAYILVTFVPSMNTPYYTTIRSVTVVWQQGGFFISFFCYILSGKIYRDELKKMFKCDRNHNLILPINSQHVPMN